MCHLSAHTFRPQLCTLDSRRCTVECKHAQLNSAANPSTAHICPGMAKCKCSIPARHRNICQWLRPLTYCTLFDVLVLLDPDMTFADDTVFNTSSLSVCIPTGSPSRGGDVMVYVININQPSLPTPFYSVLVSVSVFTALSTVFHSINSPDNSPLSHSVLPVLFLPNWSFQLHISLWKSPSALM